MASANRDISIITARRLAIARQHLSGGNSSGMLDVVRDLGCLQLDPISVVARSHQLVLWSRLGNYDPAILETLLWEKRALFEYWAHEASIVLTEDYPLHAFRMRRHPYGDVPWLNQVQTWLDKPGIRELRNTVLEQFRADGPLAVGEFKDMAMVYPGSSWPSERNAEQMVDYLWQRGEIMVARRQGLTRFWDIAERCLPDWTPREDLDDHEVTRRAAQRAIRALGVATPRQIKAHFTRRRYPDLERVLGELEAEQQVHKVRIVEDGATPLSGQYYIHSGELSLLEEIEAGVFRPRTVLLAPFDNLICDRKRTEQLFDFSYSIEIYLPKAKRRYGYYVLPILHGDRFIGRLDPKLDRKTKTLHIHSVYAEDGAPDDLETIQAMRAAIQDLAEFAGAKSIAYGATLPPQWGKLASD